MNAALAADCYGSWGASQISEHVEELVEELDREEAGRSVNDSGR